MQIHIEVVVIFLRMYRAHMNVLFTNDHIGPTKPPPLRQIIRTIDLQ